jgi:hypothetical protein
MPKLIEREALTRVFDTQGYCATGTDERNFNIMTRIELSAMLHRVQEYFSKSSAYGFPIGFRDGGILHSTKELNQHLQGHATHPEA